MNFSQITKEVSFEAIRSRGPGGQNVNKVSSAVILYWDLGSSLGLSQDEMHLVRQKLNSLINKDGILFLRSDEYRDLPRNKARVLEKLEAFLKQALTKPKPRKKTKPTYASKVKRMDSKTKRSTTKKTRGEVQW